MEHKVVSVCDCVEYYYSVKPLKSSSTFLIGDWKLIEAKLKG